MKRSFNELIYYVNQNKSWSFVEQPKSEQEEAKI